MTTLSWNNPPSGNVEDERHKRLLMDADDNFDASAWFLDALARKYGTATAVPAIMRDALAFASAIEYQHGAVPSHVYLKHPLRVAASLVDHIQGEDDMIVIALLHNVLEVTTIPYGDLAARFGAPVATAIRNLTVDRARQYDPVYKDAYYAAIEATSTACARVKVADKLDNIYMLCLNPSADIREKYLDEIDRWVVPMADRVIPEMGARIAAASKDMRKTGYLDKAAEIEKARKTGVK